MRELKYWQALSEGLVQAMDTDSSVFVMGVGVDDPKGIFGTTLTAYKKFGNERVFDIPISENTITGVAIGAAMTGMRPVMVHARIDFMLLTLDQIVNNASKWRYQSGGGSRIPMTITAIVGRGWGQGAQHSQSLQATFAHFPGLKVVMPTTPYDAKGLLISSIRDDSPVIFISHRSLFEQAGEVPEEPYEIPIGKAIVRMPGKDVTIVAISAMVLDAMKAAEILVQHNISAEVVDLRSIKPIDDECIFDSVRRTHHLVVADTAWCTCGIGSEIISRVAQNVFEYLDAPVKLVASPDLPAPVSMPLESLFYPGVNDIVASVLNVVSGRRTVAERTCLPVDKGFYGPF